MHIARSQWREAASAVNCAWSSHGPGSFQGRVARSWPGGVERRRCAGSDRGGLDRPGGVALFDASDAEKRAPERGYTGVGRGGG